ncbi:MAG: isochorismatase family cysteine hydrolase [Deltaproteobacteria bacterium]|nr:isochorismatase family cysteine hydrolase [Deltaproteobacteria bacterium]
MARRAFLDLDTQFDFMDPAGALYFAGAQATIPNLKRLIDAARETGIPVISSIDAHIENDPEFGEWPPHCVAGTPGQHKIPETTLADTVVIENRPQPIDLRPGAQVQLEKRISGLFDNVNADVVLRKIGAHEFFVFGVATEYGVKAAVLGLLERGNRVGVVTDAISAVTEEGGSAALNAMRVAGALLLTTDEVLASL